MAQLELFNVESPCIGVCQVNQRGYCVGCARSRQERFAWQTYSDAEKREVIRRVFSVCQASASQGCSQRLMHNWIYLTNQPSLTASQKLIWTCSGLDLIFMWLVLGLI